MADLIGSLILMAFLAVVGAGYGVLAILPKQAGNKRLDGHGGIMLGRGIMEVAYKLFEPLVNILYRARVTPNMVTAFSLIPAFVSAVLIAAGHFGIGALLATGSGFCDMVDGMLARRYGSMSDVGELFDAAVDRYVEYLLLAGLILYFRTNTVVLILCLGAVLGSFMVSYTTAKAEAQRGHAQGRARRLRDRRLHLRPAVGAGHAGRARLRNHLVRSRATGGADLAHRRCRGQCIGRPTHASHRRADPREAVGGIVSS